MIGRGTYLARTVAVLAVLGLGAGIGVAATPAVAATARPSVTNVTAGSGPLSGGDVVTLTGAGFGSGSTVTFGSIRATNVTVVSSSRITAKAPRHQAGRFYVHVTTTRGTSPAASGNRYRYVAAPAALPLGAAQVVSSTIGRPNAMSCPTSTFCVITDESGHAFTFDGSTATLPIQLGIGPLSGVSCSSATFCAAIGGDTFATREVRIFNGTSWTTAQSLGTTNPVSAPSCVSSSFCVAVGYDADGASTWYQYNGTTWTATAIARTNYIIRKVSCATTTFCEALDYHGHMWKFDGVSTWTDQGALFDPNAGDILLSCTSSTFCLAVDDEGYESSFNGTTWSGLDQIFTGITNRSGGPRLSCAGSTCLVTVDVTRATYFDGTTWHRSTMPGEDGSGAVSCASPGFCRVLGLGSTLTTTTDGTTWSQPIIVENWRGAIDGISCPSAGFCAATDRNGWVITDHGGTWDDPLLVDPSVQLTAVSCASASACVAVDAAGDAFRYDGTNWNGPTHIDAHGLNSISCPNPTFCMAVDSAGYNVAYSSGRWHSPRQLLATGSLNSVSCSSTVFCYAVGYGTDADGGAAGGEAVRYVAGWQAAHTISPRLAMNAVSCSSPAFCMAGVGESGVKVYTGAAWSTPITMPFDEGEFDGPYVNSLSCTGPNFCNLTYWDGDRNSEITLDGASVGAVGATLGAEPGAFTTSCWAAGKCMVAGFTSVRTVG